ncbi:MAG TPA: dienelactone hydrolase family protein [Longimicrobiales bacterium]|nr:dienelactone hydrolase family protein [Longimicrobiales bacterium]
MTGLDARPAHVYPRTILALATFVLAALPACHNGADRQAVADQHQQEPRITVNPTAPDQLPDAILGKAPPPQGENVHYFPDDTAANGYLAVPAGNGPFPALVLIHEWNGLNDRVRQVADAMAREGYIALAADLYSGRTGHTREENLALANEIREDMNTVIANLNSAVQYLRARDDVTGKVATMGWCMGGGVALSYALGGAQHDGTAVFYGHIATTDPDSLEHMHHGFYGTYAGQDQGIPPEHVHEFVQALRAAGIPNDVHIYDGVGHGFWLWVDQDPATREAPALDAWQRLKRYLKQTIGGP